MLSHFSLVTLHEIILLPESLSFHTFSDPCRSARQLLTKLGVVNQQRSAKLEAVHQGKRFWQAKQKLFHYLIFLTIRSKNYLCRGYQLKEEVHCHTPL